MQEFCGCRQHSAVFLLQVFFYSTMYFRKIWTEMPEQTDLTLQRYTNSKKQDNSKK